MKKFKVVFTIFADVHLMFATLANPEELRPYAASFDKDIIRMNLYTKYSDAASDITKRLASGILKFDIKTKERMLIIEIITCSGCSTSLLRV